MADGPAMVSTDRADRVADALGEREADVLLVTDLINVRWLTGFTGSNAAAVVGREGSRRFVTDFRYLTQSAEEVDPAWEREIAVDLLAGVVKGLPGSGRLRLASTTPTLASRTTGGWPACCAPASSWCRPAAASRRRGAA